MHKFYFFIVLSIFIAGCSDNSASVGAGNDASAGSKTGVSIDKTKSISTESSSETVVKMPAAALIGEAFSAKYQQGAGYQQRKEDTESDLYAADTKEESFKQLLELIDKDHSILEELSKKLEPEFIALVKKKDLQAMTEVAKRRNYERRFISCNEPSSGWEVSPIDKKQQKILLNYLSAIVNQCDFTNVIFTEIASKLSGKVLSDPVKARESIIETWGKIDIATIDAAWQQVLEGNKNAHYNTDLSGVKGIQFTAPNGRYVNEGGGFHVVKNGMLWYGNGALSGKVVELSLRSTIAAKAEKSKTITNESGSSTDSKSGANINVK